MKILLPSEKRSMKDTSQYLLIGSILIILVYLSPYLIWGQDCLIKTGDNLDSNVPWLTVMATNVHGLGWNYDMAPQIMNGIPKFCLGSQLNVIFLLYFVFPPFTAYVINIFIIHLVAFAGLAFLLKMIVPERVEHKSLIIFGTALCFALLDFWPSAGLSIAGQPLLIYALLQIRQGSRKFRHLLVVALFPFYSSLVLAGFFILIVLAAWILYDLLNLKRNPIRFYFAIFLLAAFYLLAEIDLARNMFINNGFVSHRLEFNLPGISFFAAMIESARLWLFGLSSHASVFQFPLILIVVLAAAILVMIIKLEGRRAFLILLAFSIAISLIGGFYHWSGLRTVKNSFAFLKTFDLSRFTFLLPTVFYLLFFYALLLVFSKRKRGTILILIIFVMQVGLAFKRNASDRTLVKKAGSILHAAGSPQSEITFRNYYSESLFRKIKEFIGRAPEDYRVLSLGIEPGIALYNGFYTLDAYVANYPLSYKKQFRRLIAQELEKDETIRHLFDDFGSTCYLYSAEIGPRSVTKYDTVRLNDLSLDRAMLSEMGCNYILSTVEIPGQEEIALEYLKRFDDVDSIWRIHLYRCLASQNG